MKRPQLVIMHIIESKYAATSIDEQKAKGNQSKKLEMLRIFEIKDEEKASYRQISPASEAMKNSLLIIQPKETKKATTVNQKQVLELMGSIESKVWD